MQARDILASTLSHPIHYDFLELMEDGACQVTLDGPGNAKQYAFFQAVPTHAPSAGSDCLLESNPGSPDSQPPDLSDIVAGLYDDELGLYDAPYSDSPRGSNHSDPVEYEVYSQLSLGSGSINTTTQGASTLTCKNTGTISGGFPTSSTFHAHRPAALRVDTHVTTPASLASTVVTSPFNLARLPAIQLGREVMHARAVDRLVGRLHSPNKQHHAPEHAALHIQCQHSPRSTWQWQHTMESTGFFSTGDKLDSRVSSPVRRPPAQGYGRAVGHRYPAHHGHGLQQQGDRNDRPSSAWLERRHQPGLLQAPIFQAVPIPLKPTHDSPVEMRPPSFSWLPKLLSEEPLYPTDCASKAEYAQHDEQRQVGNEAASAAAAAAAAEIAALRDQLQDAEAKAAASCKQLEVAEARAAALAAEKSAEFGEVAWLRQQLQEADLKILEEAEEVAKVYAQQQTATEQLGSLQRKLAAAEAKAAAAEAAAGASMREQDSAEAKHAGQLANLKAQLQAAESKVAAAEAAAARRVKEAQQAAVDRATEQIASMRQQLQAAEDRAAAAAAHVVELNKLRELLKTADAEVSRLQVQGGQLEQSLSACAGEVQALQAEVAAARSALAAFDAPSSSTVSSKSDTGPSAEPGNKAADTSSKLQSLQQAITHVMGQIAARCKAAEQQAAARQAELQEVHSILAGASTDGAGHATFMTQAGSTDELLAEHSLSVQQLAEAVVKDSQMVKQHAAEAKAQLAAVHVILSSACAHEPDVSTPTAPSEHAPSAHEGMTVPELAAAFVQEYQLAKQQSAPSLHAQVKEAHALLFAACADCQGTSAAANPAEPGMVPSVPAAVQVLQLKKLAAVLVERYKSAQQQADSSKAQVHDAHAVLQAALSVAAGSDGQGNMSLQELAAALVDRCMFAEMGLDDWRKQVQTELTQLQAACASTRAYFTRTAAAKQKKQGHGGKDYWMLQEVRTQLVDAQLNRTCAEQKAAAADAAVAAAVQELERVQQELRTAKAGLLAPTGLTSKQYRELQNLKQEVAAAEDKAASSNSELQAVRMQLAEAAAACKAAQEAQRWLPEHAAAAMAGVLGVMAVARVSTGRDNASAQQEEGDHSAGASSEQAVVRHAKHPARIPACEHPAAMLRVLRDTVRHLQDGKTLPGQYVCNEKELAAAGEVIALREASLGAAEYAVWRSVTLAADAGARARQQFEDRVGPDDKVSAEGLTGCIQDLQRCQHELVVAAGGLILQDLLLALAKQHLHQYQTGWLQLPMPSSDVVQKLLAEAAPVIDACVAAATELQATLSSLSDTQEKVIDDR